MLDERKRAVLRAIVADYVSSREPVGSKALVERHQLGVSPATIRNDMAVLEEEGYITAPHTSAGRVPTDKGYRLFVDHLVQLRPLSNSERRAIQSFLGEPVGLDDAVERTVRLLAQLTKQVAVVQYPTLGRSRIRHVEVVAVAPRRLLVVVITDSGRVDQRVVETAEDLDAASVAALRETINNAVTGRPADTSIELLAGVESTVEPRLRPVALGAVQAVTASVERRDDRVVYAGTANLAREWDDFGDSLDRVLEALEEQMVLLRLLGESVVVDDLRVSIGTENVETGLTSASVVTSGYGSGDRILAQLGVVGPTRMDYPATMTAVQAVAHYLGRLLTMPPDEAP